MGSGCSPGTGSKYRQQNIVRKNSPKRTIVTFCAFIRIWDAFAVHVLFFITFLKGGGSYDCSCYDLNSHTAYKKTKKHSMPFQHVMFFPFLCRDGMPERRHCRVTTKPGTG